jgi:peptidoglycan/xylan/chitin deacetylase (PgdA/CDA1 family)
MIYFLLLCVAMAIGFAYAVRGRSSQVFGPSVYRGDRAKPAIALTFDDGPSEGTTDLLELLKRHNVRATFFMCGKNVERLPEIARAVADAGHEIGNHSDSHPRFDFCSRAFIHGELARAQEKIAKATGVTPQLFRAPYGVRWFGLRAAQERLNMMGVMWTLIGHDWKWPAERTANLLIESARGGDVICLHDGRETQISPSILCTINALRVAIPALQDKGLKFETVGGLIGSRAKAS